MTLGESVALVLTYFCRASGMPCLRNIHRTCMHRALHIFEWKHCKMTENWKARITSLALLPHLIRLPHCHCSLFVRGAGHVGSVFGSLLLLYVVYVSSKRKPFRQPHAQRQRWSSVCEGYQWARLMQPYIRLNCHKKLKKSMGWRHTTKLCLDHVFTEEFTS